jgi:pyruvate formate lyase activating enzyme
LGRSSRIAPVAHLRHHHPGVRISGIVRGLIFNIQRYSVQDGPGIRTTVFLKGCPLECLWCHNPESQSASREVMVHDQRCLACGACLEACPCVGPPDGTARLPRTVASCTWCGACAEACPTEARQIIGQLLTAEEVLERVAQDRIFYDDSGGGVTFSGGEPLRQLEFLLALLEACRDQGWHTAVDTCGFAPAEDVRQMASLADLILYDLKLMDDATHQRYTGVSNALIIRNLELLSEIHRNLWLRVPLVPGINDDAANLDAVARLAARLPGIRQITLLPYHRSALHKCHRLGRPPALADLAPPTPAQLATAVQRFQEVGVPTHIGGSPA